MVNDALKLVDSFLLLTPHRDQFTSREVEDFLLDLRSELVVDEPVPA